MKIVCDSCGAKYSIADEKVQGKVFKIRCKKCSNVIVVKGTAESEAAGDDGLGAGASAAEWYVVIDGEQVGPVTSVEIDSYFMSGQINAETYAWKDGMGDWMHVVEIPDFAHLGNDVAGPNEATTIADAGHRYDNSETDATNVVHSPLAMGESSDVTANESGGGFADDPYPSDPGYGDDAYGYAASDAEDSGYSGFASGYDSGGGMGGDLAAAGGDDDGAGMFAAFDSGNDADFMAFGEDPMPVSNGAKGANGTNGSHGQAPIGDGLVGQRNENSVLFSLSSLDSVPAIGSGSTDTPVTEGSGLIDIQALASAHKSMSGGQDADGGSMGIDPFAQGTMAMPALMPMGSHRSNNPLYIALAVGGFAIIALGVFAIAMVLGKDDKPAEQQVVVVEKVIEHKVENPADKQKAEAEADEAEKAAQAAAAADPKKVEEDEGDEAEEKDSTPATAKKSTRKTAKTTKEKAKADPEPAPKPTKKKDGIDSILDGIDKKAQEAPKETASTSKKSLDRNDVKQTINRYNSRISTCAKSQNKSGKTGTVKVKFFIRPNGRVRGAQVTSSGFQGTDVGGCVESVVGSMTFPKTSATKDVPVTYPFILK